MNTEATHDQQETSTTGTRLRNAREQLGLSQQVVAERLCLKISTVRDIEDDKVPPNLASTFLRGYIRSYARLVRIPEEELLPVMAKQVPPKMAKATGMQSFSLGRRRKRRDGWLMSVTWLVLFVVVSLSGAWWWQNHKAQQDEITSMVEQSSVELNINDNNVHNVPLDNVAVQTPDTVIMDVQDTPEDNGVSVNTDVRADAVVAPSQASVDTIPTAVSAPTLLPTDPAGAPTSPVDPNALVINFIADCWLEVTDATGKTLFRGLQHKGDNLNLTGQEPYKLSIGLPASIQIQYQGKPVDLSRFISANQVARLTLSAEQSLAQ